MTSTSRTARCGPACRVVWQGRSLWATPYADVAWGWVNFEPEREHLLIPVKYLGPINKGVPAYLPLSPRAVEILRDLKVQADREGRGGPDDPVFGSLVADRAYRLLKTACDALEIRDFTWHDLRHEACSRLAEKGWTLPEIQAISGHRTLQSLQRYIHISKHAIHAKFRETAPQTPTLPPDLARQLLTQLSATAAQTSQDVNNLVNPDISAMQSNHP